MQRDWRVDTLRGYFLVAMTLGHFPNPLARYTEYTFGYASAPDGFVFLSGLVSAWVYLRVGQRRGNGVMVSKSLRRAGTIYFTHIALLLFGIMVALVPGLGIHRTPHPVHTFISGALLWNQVGFDRILPMYCVFMAVSPFVLQQFNKGRAWLVALASACLWSAAQFGLGDSRIDASSLDPVTFNLFAWQAYFITGQYFGYRGVQSALQSEIRGEVRSEARMRASGMVRSKALLIAMRRARDSAHARSSLTASQRDESDLRIQWPPRSQPGAISRRHLSWVSLLVDSADDRRCGDEARFLPLPQRARTPFFAGVCLLDDLHPLRSASD